MWCVSFTIVVLSVDYTSAENFEWFDLLLKTMKADHTTPSVSDVLEKWMSVPVLTLGHTRPDLKH